MRIHALTISLLVLGVLISRGQAKSVDKECSITCPETLSSNFNYEVGFTYIYDYNANVQSSFFQPSQKPNDLSEVIIQAKYELDIISPCKHTLRITQINMTNPEQPYLDYSDWATTLMSESLNYAFNDGKIGKLCASNEDPEWALNIKKGILSALQSSSSHQSGLYKEADISGECLSSYDVNYLDSNTREVTKTKQFETCQEQSKMMLFSQFTPYNSESDRQRLMHQEQSCVQTIKNDVIYMVNCHEEHVFRPFSSEQNGARTTATKTVDFVDKVPIMSNNINFGHKTRQINLAFQEQSSSEKNSDISQIRSYLSKMCDYMDNFYYDYTKMSKSFSQIVYHLRQLDGAAVAQVYESLEGMCPTKNVYIKHLFTDALKYCGEEGCVQFGAKLIAQGTLDDAASLDWLISINMVSNPTPKMLEGLVDVLESGRLKEESYLTAGSVIYGICNSQTNCIRHTSVNDALNFFEKKLGNNCFTSNEQRKQEIILALRAIGNAGITNSVSTVASCATEDRNDIEIRVSAIQALRRMPCGTTKFFENLVFDSKQDSEIRINAYITSMKCPTTNFMTNLIVMMDDEPSLQMSSFVSTHIRNLISSNDPLKGYLKPYLVEAEFMKVHDLDPRKYSHNYEMSYFSEVLNAGINGDANIVFSPKSFVPRAASLNLTLELFGQAVNIFEIGGRVEGVESILQDIMKEKNFLQNTGIGKIFGSNEPVEEDDDQNSDLDEEIDSFASESNVAATTNKYKSKVQKDQFSASWYIRMFGNEMKYGNSKYPNFYQQVNDEVSSIVNDIANGREFTYFKNMMLMSTDVTLPTMVGLPLKMAINGTANLSFYGKGKMDLSALLSTSPKLSVNAEFYPRASIVFNAEMTVDSHITTTGIQTESSALNSWKLSGVADLTSSKRFSMRVGTPEHYSPIFQFSHKLKTVEQNFRETDEYSYYHDDIKTERNCYDIFLGEELCEVKTLENSIFPENRVVFYKVYFNSAWGRDYYSFDMSYDYVADEDSAVPAYLMGDIVFDTSDKYSNLRHQMRFEMNKDEGRLTSSITYPLGRQTYNKEYNAQYNKVGNNHEVVVDMINNGTQQQWMRTTFVDGMLDETPSLKLDSTISTGSSESVEIHIAGAYKPSKIISLNSSFVGFLNEPVEFRVGLYDESNEGGKRFLVKGGALIAIPEVYKNSADVELYVKNKEDNWAATLKYSTMGQEEESMKFVHKRRISDEEQNMSFKFISSQYPNLNAMFNTDNTVTEETITSEVSFAYGEKALEKNNDKYVSFRNMFSTKGSSNSKTSISGNFQLDLSELNYRKSLDWKLAFDPMNVLVSLSIDSDDYLQVLFQDSTKENGLLHKSMVLLIPTPWLKLKVINDIQQTSVGVYRVSGKLDGGRGMKFDTDAQIQNLDNKKAIEVQVRGGEEIILDLRSVHTFPGDGFSSTNTLRSSYIEDPAILNLDHSFSEEGFESEIVFMALGNKYSANLELENLEKSSRFSTRVEFADRWNQNRFFEIVTNHNTNTQNNENSRFEAGLEISSTALPYFQHILAKTVYTTEESSIKFNSFYEQDNRKAFEVSLSYDDEIDNYDREVVLSLNQLLTAIIPEENKMIISIADNKYAINYVDVMLIQFSNTADKVEFVINNSKFKELPESFFITLAKTSNGVQGEMNVNDKVISTKIEISDNKFVAHLNNDIPQFSIIPRKTLLSAEISQNKLSSVLEINDETVTFEAFCETKNDFPYCEIVLKGDKLAGADIPQSKIVIKLDPANIQIIAGIDIDINQADLENVEGYMGSFNVKVQYQDQIYQLFGKADDQSTQSVKLIWNKSTTEIDFHHTIITTYPYNVDIIAEYSSNCEIMSGKYNLKFNLEPGLIKIESKANEKLATANFELDQNQLTKLSILLSQNFKESLPKILNFKMSYGEEKSFMILQYDEYKYVHEQMKFYPNPNEYRLEDKYYQNIFDQLYTNLEVNTSIITVDAYTSEFVSAYKADNEPIQTQRQRMVQGKPYYDKENSMYTKLYEYSYSNNYDSVWIPRELIFKLQVPQSSRKHLVASFSLDHVRDVLRLYIQGDFKQMNENVWTTSATVKSGFIAYLIDEPKFDLSFELEHSLNNFAQVSGSLNTGGLRPYTASVKIAPEKYDDNYVLVITFENNINNPESGMFLKIPSFVQFESRNLIQVNLNDASTQTKLITTVTRKYPQLNAEDVTFVNNAEISLRAELFNWNFQFGGKHDFEEEWLPKNFSYGIDVSGSDKESDVIYKSVTLRWTYGQEKQHVAFALTKNPYDSSFYTSLEHNVGLVLDYGVPGNMSIKVVQTGSDFDISVLYDTERKSIDVTFDYITASKKLIFKVEHSFVILEDYGIPSVMGIEGKYELLPSEFFFTATGTWGEKEEEIEIELSYEGESISQFTELIYKHDQSLFSEYIPKKMRVKLFREEDFNKAGIRLTVDNKDAKIGYEIEAEEGVYATEFSMSQSFIKDSPKFPRRLKLAGKIDTIEPQVSYKFILGRKTMINFDADLVTERDESSYMHTLNAELSQEWNPNFLEELFITMTYSGDTNKPLVLDTAIEVSTSDDLKIVFKNGINSDEKVVYTEMKHNNEEWNNLQLPYSLRAEAQLEGKDLTFIINRDDIQNTVALNFGLELTEQSFTISGSMSHDIEELESFEIPTYLQGRLFGECDRTNILISANVTLNEEVHSHTFKAHMSVRPADFIFSTSFIHENSVLTDLNIPNSIGLKIVSNYGTNEISTTLAGFYGEESASFAFQLGPVPKLKASAEIKSVRLNFESQAELSFNKEDNEIKLLINGEKHASVQGLMTVNKVDVKVHQLFETDILPSELNFKLTKSANNEINVEIEVVKGKTSTVVISFRPSETESVLSIDLNGENALEVIGSLVAEKGSVSFTIEQNIVEGPFPKSASFEASFEGGYENPKLTSSLKLDELTRTLSMEADVKELKFSLEHDLEIEFIPKSINVHIRGSHLDDIEITLNFNKKYIIVKYNLNTGMLGNFEFDFNIQHNIPNTEYNRMISSPIGLSAKVFIDSPYQLDFTAILGEFRGSLNAVIDVSNKTLKLQHNFEALTEYFVPSDVEVSVTGGVSPTIYGEVSVSIDKNERLISFDFDKENHIYKVTQEIPELKDFPNTVSVSFRGSSKDFEISLKIDSDERTLTFESNESTLRLAHTIPEIKSFIPNTISMKTRLNKFFGNFDLRWTIEEYGESVMSFDYDVHSETPRIVLSANNVHHLLPAKLHLDAGFDKASKNFTGHFSVNENFLSTRSFYEFSHEQGFVGFKFVLSHNFEILKEFIDPQTPSTFDFKLYDYYRKLETSFKNGNIMTYELMAESVSNSEGEAKLSITQNYNGDQRFIILSGNITNDDLYTTYELNFSQGSQKMKNNYFTAFLNIKKEDSAEFKLNFKLGESEVNDFSFYYNSNPVAAKVLYTVRGIRTFSFNLGEILSTDNVEDSSYNIKQYSYPILITFFNREISIVPKYAIYKMYVAETSFKVDINKKPFFNFEVKHGSVDIQLSLTESMARNYPKNYMLLYKVSFNEDTNKIVHSLHISTDKSNFDIKSTLNVNEISLDYKLMINQNVLPNGNMSFEAYLEKDMYGNLESLISSTTIGKHLKGEIEINYVHKLDSYVGKAALESSEKSVSADVEISATKITFIAKNSLLRPLPETIDFSFNATPSISVNLEVNEKDYFKFETIDDKVYCMLELPRLVNFEVQLISVENGIKTVGTINKNLTFDGIIQFYPHHFATSINIKGPIEIYGIIYNFDESASTSYESSDSLGKAVVNVSTKLVTFDIIIKVNVSDVSIETTFDGIESEMNLSYSKLIYRYYNGGLRLYSLEIEDQNKLLIQMGSINKRYTANILPTEEGWKLTINKEIDGISDELFDLSYGIQNDNKNAFITKVIAQYENRDVVLVNFGYNGNTGEMISKLKVNYPVVYGNFIISLNTTFDLENPALGFLFEDKSNTKLEGLFDLKQNNQGYKFNIKFISDLRRYYPIYLFRKPIYFNFENELAHNENLVDTKTSLQLNNNPALVFGIKMTRDETPTSYNYTTESIIRTGPLSKFFNIRSLSLNAWQAGDFSYPSCSYTLTLDEFDQYNFAVKTKAASSSRTDRFDMDMKLAHPHDINIFGVQLPKRNEMQVNVLQRRNGVRVTTTFNNEFVQAPISIRKSWKKGKENSFDGSLVIECPTMESPLLETRYSIHNNVLSVELNCPSTETNFLAAFIVVNNDQEKGFKTSLTNIQAGNNENWELNTIYNIENRTISVVWMQPGKSPVSITVDVKHILSEISNIIHDLLKESISDIKLLYGVEEDNQKYVVFVGVDSESQGVFTLNLEAAVFKNKASVTLFSTSSSVESKIAELCVSIVDEQFIKIELNANPEFSTFIKNIMNVVMVRFNTYTESFANNVIDIVNSVASLVSGSDTIDESVLISLKKMVSLTNYVKDQSQDYVNELLISVEDSESDFRELVKETIIDLLSYIEDINNFLTKPLDSVIQHYKSQTIQNINQIIREKLNIVKLTLDYFNAGDVMYEVIEDGVDRAGDYVSSCISDIFKLIRIPLKNLVLVTEDNIVITIPLSMKLTDVDFLNSPQPSDIKEWVQNTAMIDQLMKFAPVVQLYVNNYYRAKAFLSLPITEHIPPFKGRAFVSEFKSFRTFDGRHFDFESDCESSHILVTDGSNGNFTILVNYKEDRPSYDVRIGSESVIITSDGNVAYNNKNSILPIISEKGLSVQQVGSVIKLTFHDDLNVEYHKKTGLFAIEINPFYFASTGGLLGVFDNEPAFDFTNPDGELERSVDDFARSWEVTSSMCMSANTVTYSSEPPSACTSMFTSMSSPFVSCFPVVSPATFEDMCYVESAQMCNVAKSYQLTCKLQGVDIAMPSDCLRCVDESGMSLAIGESTKAETGSVDVVFVIQEASCLRKHSRSLSKFVRKFLKQSTQSFSSAELPNTKYYVVGYGGPGSNSEPHSFTMRGKISSSRRGDISKVIRRIDLSSNGASADAVSAINFASKLPFRAGSQQVILHLSCDMCGANSMSSQVQNNLLNKKVQFHHMPIQSIESTSDNKIYGYSSGDVFAKKSKETERSSIVEASEDSCAEMATKSNGSVWSGKDMKSSELVTYMTSYMTENIRNEISQNCICLMNEETGEPETVCQE